LLGNPALQSPPPQFEKRAEKSCNVAINMANQGYGGFTTVLWQPSSTTGVFTQALAAAASLQAAQPGQLIFSIMLGANDSAQSGITGSPVSAFNYRQNLQVIVDQFLTNYPDAYVFVHYPIWYSTNTGGAV